MKESDSFAREERIRAKAYQIWLDEGCPDGRDEAHWEMARELVAIEDNPESGRMPIPDGDQVGEWGEPVEDSQVAANSVGELPTTVDEDEQLYPPSRANARKVATQKPAAPAKSRSPRRPPKH
ncbi:MAG TPA: DUF2934 domain-containing protein [Aestuariivirgaceae bacterium]|jgi:hypothetical protein|nr:DUF2934 domain-containing protein [Aestuariivirgaceae bacterium]